MGRRPQGKPPPRQRRERGSGRIYQDVSKGRWVAALSVEGRLIRRLFRTEAEAIDGLAALHADAAAHRIDLTRQTLAQFIAEWLAEYILAHRSNRTYEAYAGKLEKHVLSRIGTRRLASIEPRDIRDLYARLRTEGTTTRHKEPKARPLSPTTIANVHTILHSAFTWAVREERIPRNPCDFVHPPQGEEYEATTFDEEQVPLLLAAIKGHRYEWLWRFQLATGQRHGEATGLRREDVDEARMAARLYEAVAYVPPDLRTADDPRVWWERKRPKTARSRRHTPLTLPALAAIRHGLAQATALREAAGDGWFVPDQDLVFPDDDGRPIRENKVYKAWGKMLEAAGLPKCRPHDLRHSAAEMALGQGAELIDVSRLLGHANTTVTDRVYAGRNQQGARRAAERVARAFGDEKQAETGP